MSKAMNITADQIQRSCTGTQLLNQTTKTIMKTFQSEIVEAGKNGSTEVTVGVPTNFAIANMANKTAQTIIYHQLIQELEESGFNVRLDMSASAVMYRIRWDIKKDAGDLKKMRTVIAQHLEQPLP